MWGRGGSRSTRPKPRSMLFPFRPRCIGPVHDGLWMVVNGAGTGSARAGSRATMCRARPARRRSFPTKGSRRRARRPWTCAGQRWFVFFAPRDNPEIAGVVFVEHARTWRHRLGADREIRAGDVLREEGHRSRCRSAARQNRAAAPHAPCRMTAGEGRASRATLDVRRRTGLGRVIVIVERRLSAHLDWPLLGGAAGADAHRSRRRSTA